MSVNIQIVMSKGKACAYGMKKTYSVLLTSLSNVKLKTGGNVYIYISTCGKA